MINPINTVECRVTCIYLALKDMGMLHTDVGVFCVSLMPYALHPPEYKWLSMMGADGNVTRLSYKDIYDSNKEMFKTMAKDLCGTNNI